MGKVPKIGNRKYFCNILKKSFKTAFAFCCDAKHFDILWTSGHGRCDLLLMHDNMGVIKFLTETLIGNVF